MTVESDKIITVTNLVIIFVCLAVAKMSQIIGVYSVSCDLHNC